MLKKICSKCGKNKLLEQYYKDNRAKDGRYSDCKSCSNATSKKYNAEHKREIAENTLTVEEFNCILFLQNYQCIGPNHEGSRYFDEVEPQKDHIVPVSKGGNFTKETVQALCKSCDSKKGTKYIDYRTDYHKEMIRKL